MTLIELLQRHRVEFRRVGEHRHTTTNWVSVDCPWCGPQSRRFHLGIHVEGRGCNCWRCGPKKAFDAISRLCRHATRSEIVAITTEPLRNEVEVKQTGQLKLPDYITDLQTPHRRYLSEKRKLDPDKISSIWGVRAIGLSISLPWRLFIPIHNRGGNVVSWTTRSISDNVPNRYVSAPSEEEEVPHKSILYGAHLARNAIIVVEGPIDAWAIGPGAVATCGTAFSGQQMAAMGKYPVRVVCFDGELEAQKRAEYLCSQLEPIPGKTVCVQLGTGKDAASADRDEVNQLRCKYLE